MTTEKSPNVTTVTGKKSNLRTGFTIDCKNNKTTAAITKVTQLLNETAGTNQASKPKVITLDKMLLRIFPIYL